MTPDFFEGPMARPLGVRGYQKRRFTKASVTMGQELHVESVNEGCTLLALDVDPRVKRIKTQPFTLRLDLEHIFKDKKCALAAYPSIGAKDRQMELEMVYTPDFLVEAGRDVPLVVECKPSDEIHKIKTAVERRGEVLNKLGYHFMTVSELDIGFDGLLGNLVRMRDAINYQRKNDTRSEMTDLTQLLGERSDLFPLSDIRGQVSDLAINLGLAFGVLACDLRKGALGVKTVVWRAEGDLSHLQLLNLGA